MKLSAEARGALRKAITNHDSWTSAYRRKTNLSLSSMGVADYLAVANDFGIDVEAIIRDTGAAKNEAARAAFDNAVEREAGISADEFAEYVERQPIRDEIKRVTARVSFPAISLEDRATMATNSDDAANKLAALIAELAGGAKAPVDADMVRKIVAEEFEKHSGPVVRIEITENGLPVGKVDGFTHPQFRKLLRAATAKGVDGFSPNVWISGPAGSGKTHAAKQIARALDIPFHFNGAIGMQHELLGFIDAGGTYHRTAFREAYEHGGVYLFDEVDGSDNAALLALNAALANGFATFPDGTIERHRDCRIFAAANTWGFGATSDYVGRAKIDAAFLSRFPVRVNWSYDDQLEQNICGNPDVAKNVQLARRAAAQAGLKVLITPRDSIAASALVAAGATIAEAAEDTYLAPLTNDQRNILESTMVSLRRS